MGGEGGRLGGSGGCAGWRGPGTELEPCRRPGGAVEGACALEALPHQGKPGRREAAAATEGAAAGHAQRPMCPASDQGGSSRKRAFYCPAVAERRPQCALAPAEQLVLLLVSDPRWSGLEEAEP